MHPKQLGCGRANRNRNRNGYATFLHMKPFYWELHPCKGNSEVFALTPDYDDTTDLASATYVFLKKTVMSLFH